MAFVIEEKSPDMKEKYPIGSKWVIDHERNAFLVSGGAHPEMQTTEMHVGNDVVIINQNKRHIARARARHEPMVYDIYVDIDRVFIPQSMEYKKEEILSMVREAFTVFGFSCDASRNDSVTVENLDDPTFIKIVEQTKSRYE